MFSIPALSFGVVFWLVIVVVAIAYQVRRMSRPAPPKKVATQEMSLTPQQKEGQKKLETLRTDNAEQLRVIQQESQRWRNEQFQKMAERNQVAILREANIKDDSLYPRGFFQQHLPLNRTMPTSMTFVLGYRGNQPLPEKGHLYLKAVGYGGRFEMIFEVSPHPELIKQGLYVRNVLHPFTRFGDDPIAYAIGLTPSKHTPVEVEDIYYIPVTFQMGDVSGEILAIASGTTLVRSWDYELDGRGDPVAVSYGVDVFVLSPVKRASDES